MKVSIIVAVYNTSQYLEQCLETVLNQSMSVEDYEVIIVNDCSTDNSIEIINRMTEGRTNVTVIDKKVNEATFWSRVDGIIASKGEYVGFVDSDDWVELPMYETMYKKGTELHADIVECGTIYEYDDGSQSVNNNRIDEEISISTQMYKYAYGNIQYALYLRLFSRRVINTFLNDMYPYFDARREEYRGVRNEDDLLYPLFVSSANKILYIEESFCHHRASVPGSTMDEIRTNPKKLLDSWIYRVNAGIVCLRFTAGNPEVSEYLEHKQINNIFSLMGNLLESHYYSNKESQKMIDDAISQFIAEKRKLTARDYMRFMHLRVKALYCFRLNKGISQ